MIGGTGGYFLFLVILPIIIISNIVAFLVVFGIQHFVMNILLKQKISKLFLLLTSVVLYISISLIIAIIRTGNPISVIILPLILFDWPFVIFAWVKELFL